VQDLGVLREMANVLLCILNFINMLSVFGLPQRFHMLHTGRRKRSERSDKGANTG
jgi:hypothetical protein